MRPRRQGPSQNPSCKSALLPSAKEVQRLSPPVSRDGTALRYVTFTSPDLCDGDPGRVSAGEKCGARDNERETATKRGTRKQFDKSQIRSVAEAGRINWEVGRRGSLR